MWVTGLTGKRRARRRRRRTAGWNAGGLVAFGCSELGQMGGGSTGLLIGLEVWRFWQEIIGIDYGGAISGGRDFWAEEEGRRTSADVSCRC